MLAARPRTVLGKIAADLSAALHSRTTSGAQARTRGTALASGPGWKVSDVICTAGPRDPVFEEQHAEASVAVVVAGSFQYRTPRGLHLMTAGSFFLGNSGECYECGHEHAAGDRCVAFHYTAEFIDRLAAEVGVRRETFGASRLPPMRDSSGVVAAIATGLVGGNVSWDEMAIDVAATALRASSDDPRGSAAPAAPRREMLGRVTHAVRAIDRDPGAPRTVASLAAGAGSSVFQFLRAFRRLTGTTPHQYLLRARLRESAAALRATDRKVAEIALDCGFNDLSNFNHAFRAELGVSPRAYRARHARR